MACAPVSTELLSDVLALVERRRRLDLTCYRRPTLLRRLANRMIAAGAGSAQAYRRLLDADPAEIDRLLTTLTVKVSRFYRNAPVFDALRTSVIPELRRGAGGAPLRLWSAGCANGEEAYTLALLADPPVSIDATDIDVNALAAGRAGRYLPAALGELPLDLAGRLGDWTSEGTGGVTIDPGLRARVRFTWHDLTSSAPPPGGPYHLVCCRNVLIYLTPDTQRTVTAALLQTLRPGGVLCLGEAEWPVGEAGAHLEVIDRRAKLFRKTAPREGASR